MVVQSVIFKTSIYSPKLATEWLKLHRLPFKKIHKTKNFIRFRLLLPLELKKEEYSHYIIKSIDNGNIKLIMAYK